MAMAAAAGPMALTITPLTGSVGARIDGVDFRREIAPEAADGIRRAFAHYAVLLFRGERAAMPEEQHRLAALFGEPQPLQVFQFLGKPQAGVTFEPGSRIAASQDAAAPTASKPWRGAPSARRCALTLILSSCRATGWGGTRKAAANPCTSFAKPRPTRCSKAA
ncbi:MAG: TauD/TfdA family dioxygenase [Novosphingobium sp.]|jgi:hypothetical protein|nr:TauD/TfdA family dioxygenase [Novosphingobium sp.]